MALNVLPVNPDQRCLPSGWSECYDKEKDRWYYIQNNVVPARISVSHPCNEINEVFTIEKPRPTGSANVADRRQAGTPPTPPSKGLTAAQRLYASALPARYTSTPSATVASGLESSRYEPASTTPNASTNGRMRTSTVVSMASVSAQAYGHTNTKAGDSTPSGQSLYRSSVVQQLPQNRPLGARKASSPPSTSSSSSSSPSSKLLHVSSRVPLHRPQSLQVTRPSSSSSPEASPHRFSTYSPGVTSFTRPYEFTKPTETPNITLVARPPSFSNTRGNIPQQQDTHAAPNASVLPPPPYLPASASASSVSLPGPNESPTLTLSPVSPASNSSGASSAGFMHALPPSSPPASVGPAFQATNVHTPSLASVNPVSSPVRPVQVTNGVPHRPPFQQGPSPQVIVSSGAGAGAALSQAGSLQSHAVGVLSQLGRVAGRAALRYVGRAVIGSVLAQAPDLLSGLASGLLDNNLLDTLSSSLANFDVSAAGIDLTQFLAAFQGVPGTDYQGIIDLMGQQQQMAPEPGVNYHAIISALTEIQHAMQVQTAHPAGVSAAGHQGSVLNGQLMQLPHHSMTGHETGAAAMAMHNAASINTQLHHQQQPQQHHPQQQQPQQPIHPQQQQQHVPLPNSQQHIHQPQQQAHVQPSPQSHQTGLHQLAHVQPQANAQQQQSHIQQSQQQNTPKPHMIVLNPPTHDQCYPLTYSQQQGSHSSQQHGSHSPQQHGYHQAHAQLSQQQSQTVLHQQSQAQPHPQVHPQQQHQPSYVQPVQQQTPSYSQPHQQAPSLAQPYLQSHPQQTQLQQTAPQYQQPHAPASSQSPQHQHQQQHQQQAFHPGTGGSFHPAVSSAHPAIVPPPQYHEAGGSGSEHHPTSAESSSMSSAIANLSHHFMNMTHNDDENGEQSQSNNASATADGGLPPPLDADYGGVDNEQVQYFSSVDYGYNSVPPPAFNESAGVNVVFDPIGFADGSGFVSDGSYMQSNTFDMQTTDQSAFYDGSGPTITDTTIDSNTFVNGLGMFSETVDTTSFVTGDGDFYSSAIDQVTFTTRLGS